MAKTVAEFKTKEKFILIISPEGTREANSWRSGYFYLAKDLCVPIIIAGLDYELQRPVIKIFYDIHTSEDREYMEYELKKEMADIVPLYPSCSPIPIREHNKARWINVNRLLYLTPYLLICLWYYYN